MKKIINNNHVWLEKWFDFKHGYGWHCHVYNHTGAIGYGFSKNKFTAYKLAVKDI